MRNHIGEKIVIKNAVGWLNVLLAIHIALAIALIVLVISK